MKKINKIFITLASIVSISSLPIVAASCDVEKTEEGTGANSDTKDQEDQTLSKRPKGTNSSKGPTEEQTHQKTKRNKLLKRTKRNQTSKRPKGTNSSKGPKQQTPPKETKRNKLLKRTKRNQTPPKRPKGTNPSKGPKQQTPPKRPKGTNSSKGPKATNSSKRTKRNKTNTKKYRLPKLKEFLDKNDDKLFETDGEKMAKNELEA